MTPFNGDPFLHAEIGRLIGKWSINLAVETGTNCGHTAYALSILCPGVITVEINEEHFNEAKKFFLEQGAFGLLAFHGSSPDIIRQMGGMLRDKRILYYLDAHGEDYWPLLDELKEIFLLGGYSKPIIVIHDVKVPGHPDAGFDSYHGQDLDFEYVADGLKAIYGPGDSFKVNYNRAFAGPKQGVMFVEPL
jgi:predicted O-methyltransferase YrrM